MAHAGEVVGLSLYLGAVSLIGAILNLLILFTILRLVKQGRCEISHIIISNLALSDLLSCLTVMPYNLASNIDPGFSSSNHFLCQAGGLLTYPFFIVSQTSLLLFTVEKYISIAYPLRHCVLVTKPRVIFSVVLTWVTAAVFVIPLASLGWIEYSAKTGICGVIWAGKSRLVFLIMTALICFCLPFIIGFTIHIFIFITVKRHMKRIHVMEELASDANSRVCNTSSASTTRLGGKRLSGPVHRPSSRRFSKELKAAKMVFIILLEFLVCLSPYAVTRVLRAVSPKPLLPGTVYKSMAWLWYFTAICNPVIYLAFQKETRRGLRTLLPCFS